VLVDLPLAGRLAARRRGELDVALARGRIFGCVEKAIEAFRDAVA
jgi:hypothetical protein